MAILSMILGSAYGGFMLYDNSLTMIETDKHKAYYEYGAYAVWGLSFILLCCVCCNLKNIRIGVAVMKCTAAFLGGTPQVFLVPPLSLVFVIGWLFVWLVITAYLASIGKLTQRTDFTFLTNVQRSQETDYMLLYSLFGYLWLNAFIIGVSQFIISAACAIWYFTSTSDSNGSGSLTRGLFWVFRYHLGSIAFGSFLIALVQLIRIIFEYYKSKIEKLNKNNPAVKIILCVSSCCLACLERFIKFISKNAYIQIAITGKNFCAAAWNAFILILKNALRFGTANAIGFIFRVLGVAFICTANGCFMYAMITYVDAYRGLASNWLVPCVIALF